MLVDVPTFVKMTPGHFPVRLYPDITHSVSDQLPVPDWDPAYQFTLNREPVNPRPTQQAAIAVRYFNKTDDYSIENHESSLENHDYSIENHDFCGSGDKKSMLTRESAPTMKVSLKTHDFLLKNDDFLLEDVEFITKCDEGCHDDVNKHVWLSIFWGCDEVAICITIDEFCITNDGFFITNGGFCTKHDGFCV